MEYQGKWALITGASAGIGEGFARKLAANGANLILVARRQDRLQALAEKLVAAYNIDVRIINSDLGDPEAPHQIIRELSADAIDVDILINNAGFGLPGYFNDNDWQAHRDVIALMVTSYAHLTHAFLPGMLERDYGRIIQVASLAGLVPAAAGHTVYGALKAFLVSFSESLAAETCGTGVKVSALCPGFTYTEFHDVNGMRELVSQLPKPLFMNVEPVVDGALRAVERSHVVYVPGNINKFIAWFTKALPRPWAAALGRNQSARFRQRK